MIKRIVIALDGSPIAEKAIPWARLLAPQAQLTLLQVIDPTESDFPDEFVPKAGEYLRATAKEFAPQAETRVEVGSVVSTLLNTSEKLGADLIAATTYGGISPKLSPPGSITIRLVHALTTPMLIVPPDAPVPAKIKNVVTPLDGSKFAESILGMSVQVAQAHEAAIHLIHVIEKPTKLVERPLPWLMETAEALMGKIARRLEQEKVRVISHVAEGRPVEGILGFSKQHHADLMVMSAHGYGAVQRALFGTIADRLVRRSPMPILVARAAR